MFEFLLSSDFLTFVLIGFLAQLVDGALGMAFGVLSTTALLSAGVPPARASAMTHVAECFTTAASGLSHIWQRNVDWRLVFRLAPFGMAGGALGAYALSSIDGEAVAPFISVYLIGIGVFILYRASRRRPRREMRDWTVPYVGGLGGLLDAMGGGGWGPMVTSTLLGRGHDPRKVIGSTNLTEFLVTLTVSLTFLATLGVSQMLSASGLIVGGVLAAPLGAVIVARLPARPLMIAVGLIIIATAVFRLT